MARLWMLVGLAARPLGWGGLFSASPAKGPDSEAGLAAAPAEDCGSERCAAPGAEPSEPSEASEPSEQEASGAGPGGARGPRGAAWLLDRVWAKVADRVQRMMERDMFAIGLATTATGSLAWLLRTLFRLAQGLLSASYAKAYVKVEVADAQLCLALALWLDQQGVLARAGTFRALPTRGGESKAEALQQQAQKREQQQQWRPGGKGAGKGGQGAQERKHYSLTGAEADVMLLPAGQAQTHRILFRGQPIWVTLNAKGARWRGGGKGQWFQQDGDAVQLQALSLGVLDAQSLLRGFLTSVQREYLRRGEATIDVWRPEQGEWRLQGAIPKRPVHSLVLRDGLIEDVLADAEQFVQEEAWYAERQIPHRRGYLLEGPPGCGKTSLIRCVASELGLPLCIMSARTRALGDRSFEDVVRTAPEAAILVFEDVDAGDAAGALQRTKAADENSRSRDAPVTLSELLNALDGLGAQTGRLVFLTTNHPEALDPALLRPGRVDQRYHLGYCDADMAKGLFLSICGHAGAAQGDQSPRASPERREAADKFAAIVPGGALSAAALQGFLVRHHRLGVGEILQRAKHELVDS